MKPKNSPVVRLGISRRALQEVIDELKADTSIWLTADDREEHRRRALVQALAKARLQSSISPWRQPEVVAPLLGQRSPSRPRRIPPHHCPAFSQPAAEPWKNLLGGLVLGSQALLDKAAALAGHKTTREDPRWSASQQIEQRRARLQQLLADEPDDRLRIWARVKLAGDRGIDVARDFGYHNGSGVSQVIHRLERQATRDQDLQAKLQHLRKSLSNVVTPMPLCQTWISLKKLPFEIAPRPERQIA